MSASFYKFFGLPAPRGVSQKEAVSFRFSYLSGLPEERHQDVAEWEAFEELYEEINEEFREEIKKVGISDHRATFQAARAENTVDDLQSDPALIVDKLIEMKPSLKRS